MGRIPQSDILSLLSKFQGDVGLYVENLDDGEVFEINPAKVFPSASIIKIPLMGLLLLDAKEGKIDLHTPHVIKEDNRVGGTGILCELNRDYSPSLYYLCKLMIILSDNTATNEIIDVVGGFDRFNVFCKSLGYENTSLNRKMMDYEGIKQGRNNYMTAGETGRMLSEIARGQFIDTQISETIIDMMNSQQYRNKLPALLPVVPIYTLDEDKKNPPPGTVLVGNKTGEVFGTQHDVGVFMLPGGRRYIISMFTGNLEHDADGITAISHVSKIVYEALR